MVILASFALLFLRIILAIMFIDSGRRHVQNPQKRAKGLGLPVRFVILLGLIEAVGGILLVLGIFAQHAAFFLAGVMIGALFFKLFVWHTGIYGEKGNGWYYDALLLAGVGIIFTFGAGPLTFEFLL